MAEIDNGLLATDVEMIANFKLERIETLIGYIKGKDTVTICKIVKARDICSGIKCSECPFEENTILIDALEKKVVPYVKTIKLLSGNS